VTVFACHKMQVVYFNLFTDKLTLRFISILDQCLKQTTTIVFETKLSILISNMLD